MWRIRVNRIAHRTAYGSMLFAVLLLLSCGPGHQVISPPTEPVDTLTSPASVVTPPVTAEPLQPTDAAPTHTAEPTLALVPTQTTEPAPTPTARVSPPITLANAGQVELLDRLGTGALQGITLLPDGQTVVAAFYSGLSLCDAGTLRERRFTSSHGWKSGLAASPDGSHVALVAEDGVQLWDTGSGQMVHTLAAPGGGAKLIAFGAGGMTLAISGPEVEGEASSESVAVWDIAGLLDARSPGGQLLYRLEGFVSPVSGLAFSPDGGTLLTVRQHEWSNPNDAAPLAVWDARTGQPLPVEGDLSTAPDGLAHLVFSPDGRLLAGSVYSTISIWDAETGDLRQSLENQSWPNAMAFSSDGRWLAAGSSDKLARVWDVSAGELRATVSGHTGWVTGVAFAPPDRSGAVLLITGTSRDGLQLWDVESGERLAHLRPVGHTDAVQAMAYSPDGQLLATASPDETLWFWDAETGQAVGMLDAYGMSTGEWCACIWSLAFSPDGETVATGSTDARVRQWDVQTAELLYTSQAMGDLISGLGFSPDGQLLAAGDSDGNIWVWDLGIPLDAPPLLTFDNRGVIVSLAFDPTPSSLGGRLLATGSGFGAIRVWDADTGTMVREMEGSHNAVSVVYSPDGSLLAAGDSGWGDESPVRLWDPSSGALQKTLVGHSTDVDAMAFSPNGQVLVSGDWDGSARLWDLATGEQLQVLQAGSYITGVAFRPDGRRFATAGFDGLVWIWGQP